MWTNKGQSSGSRCQDKEMIQYWQILREAFKSEFLSQNKDFPGSFPGSSISVHLITLRPGAENWIAEPRPLPIILPSFLLPQISISCALWQVVGIQRCKAPSPSSQIFSDLSRQTNGYTDMPKCWGGQWGDNGTKAQFTEVHTFEVVNCTAHRDLASAEK